MRISDWNSDVCSSDLEQVVGTTVSVALRNFVMGVGGIIYLFSLSPKLTAGILLGIPVIILPIMLLGRRLQNVSRTSQDRVADIGATTDRKSTRLNSSH